MTEVQDTNQSTLSYGQKAVGITFNPSNDPEVQKIKETFAAIIDGLNDKRGAVKLSVNAAEQVRMLSIAITHAQEAQMWAVKAVTWKP